MVFFSTAAVDFGAESDCTDNKQDAGACKESDASSNVSDVKVETGTGSSLSNYRYKTDYGSTGGVPDSLTAAADDRRMSATPKSGAGSLTTLTRGGGGIPLAGPVPVDPQRYSATATTTFGYLGNQQNAMHHHPLSSSAAIGDYAEPLSYVRYNNNIVSIRIPTNVQYTPLEVCQQFARTYPSELRQRLHMPYKNSVSHRQHIRYVGQTNKVRPIVWVVVQ